MLYVKCILVKNVTKNSVRKEMAPLRFSWSLGVRNRWVEISKEAIENSLQIEGGNGSLTRDFTDLWRKSSGPVLGGCQDHCSSNRLSTSVCI